jgi:hypothetical protein
MKAKDLFSKEKKEVTGDIPHLNAPFFSPVRVRGIIVGVILLIVLTQIGFFRRYIQFFPTFDGFTAAQHFHGMMMMGWLLMLLVQPILILKGKTELHRRIGTLSYVLAPLVLLSIYLVIQSRYYFYLEQGGQTTGVIGWLSLNFRLMVFFAVLYVLAIYYRRRPALHMRYMVSTAFVLIGPGLVRVLISYPEWSNADSHSFDRNANILIAGVVTIVDSWRTKRLSPFALVLGFMVLQKILWDMREAPLWQEVGKVIATMF